MEPAISIKGLTKSYGDVWALHNFSMEVREREFFGFLWFLPSQVDLVIREHRNGMFTSCA